ncbi:MAG: hypothetical protein KKD25_01990 [Gammaproteobacteria bacterium]|nr:hypothetical protein [Gammaproteobacteria bacterium]MBU0771817.1 hypothetical protein [Gammaproteobacteria bacterium]MBU0855573.1 hypothetical protein [Gammaproteobacteria bacterium]MBU1846135.1 hypothetical protein [Gammaproteobacteria bacterium]
MTKKKGVLGDSFGDAGFAAGQLEALRRIGKAASAVCDSLDRFDNAVRGMRDSLGAEPVSEHSDELISALRLIAYMEAALADPVVQRSPSSSELAAHLLRRLNELVLDEFDWPSVVGSDVAAGVRAYSSDISRMRGKVKNRESFKEWVKSDGLIVDHVDQFRSMPRESMPRNVFDYVMKSKDRVLREAYNEVRPGTLKPGRRSRKK